MSEPADIPFRQIPSNLRVPLFYAELDNSHASTATPNLRALLIGGMTSAGVAAAAQPQLNQGVSDAVTQYGPGSSLAGMVAAYRANDSFGEMWALPLADAGAAVAAVGNVLFAGPATAAGVVPLYVAGVLVPVTVTSGMTAAQIATAAAAAVNANIHLPVTAAVDATPAQVDFTAKNKGIVGNDIDIRIAYLGSRSGEMLPAGITATITAMTGGATNPTLGTALANLSDMPFEFIACAFTDAASLTALTAFMNETTGRWSWQAQIFGHVFVATRGTFSALTTFGAGLNDNHMSAIGMNDTPTPMWKVAAALCAQAAISVRADPAQPIRGVVLQGVLAPPVASRFSLSQRNTLLFDGVSTFNVDQAGNVILEKLITTYQKNTFGQLDNSYLDAETLFNLAAVIREYRQLVQTKYGRVKLADDGTFLPPGGAIVTPKMIRLDIVAKNRDQCARGLAQNPEAFAAALIVQKNSQNPNRIDVLLPETLIDRLDVFAALVQFRLS